MTPTNKKCPLEVETRNKHYNPDIIYTDLYFAKFARKQKCTHLIIINKNAQLLVMKKRS